MQTEKHSTSTEVISHGVSYADALLAVQEQVGEWPKFTKKLKARKKQSGLRKLLGRNCLLWGLPSSDAIYCSTIARLVQLKSSTKSDDFDFATAAEDWITKTEGDSITVPVAIEALAWASALPNLPQRIEEEQWKRLLARLIYLTQPLQQKNVESRFVTFALSAELSLMLAHACPELSICKKRIPDARQQFERMMDAMLDGEGMPHASYLECIQLMLASCTRTLTVDGLLKKGRIAKAARLQFDWLCRQTLRMARPNGSLMFRANEDSPHFDALMKSALAITEDDSDIAAWKSLRSKRKSTQGDELPAASEHSEWSEIATMRTNWSPNAARMAVVFSERELRTEFSVGDQIFFMGKCNPKVTVDGHELNVASDWEEVCWESDEDMDYIELDAKLDNNWRIQRQLLLARKDSFAFVADAIIGSATAEIRYQNPLPLLSGVTLDSSGENSEAMLLGEKPLGTVCPLSLSEWKTPGGKSRLREDPARLELHQRGRGLYAPLFIDFDPNRRNKALTWRSLTVAENLQTVVSDVAVAYRVQIGKKQWVIYRSLAKSANRTFLGLNLTSEFLVARFQSDGEIEPLVDVSV